MNNGMGNIPILVCMTPDHEVYQHSYTHPLLTVTTEGDIFFIMFCAMHLPINFLEFYIGF